MAAASRYSAVSDAPTVDKGKALEPVEDFQVQLEKERAALRRACDHHRRPPTALDEAGNSIGKLDGSFDLEGQPVVEDFALDDLQRVQARNQVEVSVPRDVRAGQEGHALGVDVPPSVSPRLPLGRWAERELEEPSARDQQKEVLVQKRVVVVDQVQVLALDRESGQQSRVHFLERLLGRVVPEEDQLVRQELVDDHIE